MMLTKSLAVAMASNAVYTAAAMTVPAVGVFVPDIAIQPLFWGLIGGAARWLAVKLSWRDGLISVAMGGIMAAGLDGASIPFFDAFFDKVADESSQRVHGFLIGMFGGLIFGAVQDLINARKPK